MRICRFDNDRLGLVVDAAAAIVDVSAALEFMPPLHRPLAPGDPLVANLAMLRPHLEALASTATVPTGRLLFPQREIAKPQFAHGASIGRNEIRIREPGFGKS